MAADRERARGQVARGFRWHEGHADLAGIFADGATLAVLGPTLAEPFASAGVTGVVAIEARGFPLGALVAHHLGVGLVLARKPGGLHPGAIRRVSTSPDWRGDHVDLGVSSRAVSSDDRLLLVDDWVQTGAHVRTAVELLHSLGAEVVGTTVMVDDTTPDVREAFGVVGLLRSDELRFEG